MNRDIVELIGVYDADSTLIGELSYWIGARLGTRHCSLCELTHGLFTKKSEWTECSRNLSVPFRTFHRNDSPSDVRDAAAGHYPIVLARTANAVSVVLEPTDIDAFGGSTARFNTWLIEFLG
ncbi:MAG: hypothetical protein ACKOD2_15520 [Ilumatobacteraceae bacterium]